VAEPPSDSGDVFDQAAQRPLPAPLNLGPSKDVQPPEVGIHSLADPSFLTSIPTGIAKSAGQTVNTISKGLNAIPGIGETLAPSQGIQAAESMESFGKDINTPEGLGEAAGAGLESLGEFILGDEALKGLTLGDKYNLVGKIHKALEMHPASQRAMELGIQAIRQGAVTGGVTAVHGASPSEALTAAGMATVLGVPVGQITHWTPEVMDAISAAQANKYVKTPADLLIRAVNPPEEVTLSGAEGEGAAREYAKFDKELKSNLPYIIGTAQEQGKTPMGRRDLTDLAVQTADKFNTLYQREILQPVKDVQVGAKAKIPNYKGAMDSMTGEATLQQLDDRLDKINDMLYKSYERGKGGLPSEAAIGEASELTSEARGIRKLLYSELQNRVGDRLGVNVAEVRTRNGQLRDVADTMERRWQQARAKANTPLGESARSIYQGVEQGAVRAKRAMLGDPRDGDIRAGWKMLQERGDHGLPVSIQGPSVPPHTNAFAERTPGYVNIPARPTDIVWEGSTPKEIAAQKAKITGRADVVKGARQEAAKKIQQNKASHGPRGVSDATGEP
jgi:hypothetical protein